MPESTQHGKPLFCILESGNSAKRLVIFTYNLPNGEQEQLYFYLMGGGLDAGQVFSASA